MCSAPAAINILPCTAFSRAMSGSDIAEPSPKRAKVELPSFAELDLKQLALVDNGVGRNGGKLLMPLLGNNKLRCNLTPKGFLKAPFGFDVSFKYEKPSFLGGVGVGKSEGLALVLQLGREEATMLAAVNGSFCQKFTALDQKTQWHDLLNVNDKHGTSVKVKIVLQGENLTQLKIVTADKTIVTGYGWEFLQPYLAENGNFRGSLCKVSVCLERLWCVSRKAGISLTATHLVLAPGATAAGEDAYDDDELMAELGALW